MSKYSCDDPKQSIENLRYLRSHVEKIQSKLVDITSPNRLQKIVHDAAYVRLLATTIRYAISGSMASWMSIENEVQLHQLRNKKRNQSAK